MDPVAREDIAAAAAARKELGSSYDDVIAESLIERIGAEIDKRVDARLAGRRLRRRADVAELERRRTLLKGAVGGATAVGLPALLLSMKAWYGPAKGVMVVVVLLWLVIAVGYGAATWVHAMRRGDD
jgi:hypothetical protein